MICTTTTETLGTLNKMNEGEKNLQSGALKIPEILEEVMQLSERPDRAASARVCRSWTPVAIDVLWRDLDSIFPLLELIAPLERDAEGSLIFPDLIQPVDWERLDSYACRVRSLVYDDTEDCSTWNGYTGRISERILSDVHLNRLSSGSILPNVIKVNWIAEEATTTLLLLFFLSSRTQHLRIELGSRCPTKIINSLLKLLGSRVASVIEFKFFIHRQVDDVDEELAKCLMQMEALERVMLPRRFGAPKVVTALTCLKQLKSLRILGKVPQRNGTVSQIGTQWDTKLEAFQTLEILDFQTTLSRAESALTSLTPLCLQSIVIIAVDVVSNQELASLFSAMATSCPQLRKLWLNLYSGTTKSTELSHFGTLKPLFDCRLLQDLEIGHPRSIQLTEGNIISIANAWSELTRLFLMSNSLVEEERTPLSLLKAFARYMPGLQQLGLPCRLDLDGIQTSPTSQAFESLLQLHLGRSAVSPDDVDAVTAFLGFICPPGSKIDNGASRWQFEPRGWVMNRQTELWAAVGDGIGAFHQIQRGVAVEIEQS
ncbi:hypothetical protein FRB93_010892 [Tulasnella sp. JGI-2019a]|nr:hypothetical protein FRB93_010892 [Tulasnella sp. JGI-2019a]